MRLTEKKRQQLIDMIESQTFFGLSLGEISVDILDEIDEDDVRDLYIVTYMLGCEIRDIESYEQFPYEACEYLKKFRL